MASLFTFEDLKELVRLTGELLKKEDQIIREDFHKNRAYATSGQIPGIANTNLQDERYYQRLTWRALLPTYWYSARLEYQGFDIALFRDGETSPSAIGQMKKCLGTGFEGVSEANCDRENLAKQPYQSCAHFLLIFTAAGFTPLGESCLDAFVGEALDRMECSVNRRWLYRFNTPLDKDGHGTLTDGEFGVLGVLLKDHSLGPTQSSG